MLSFLVVFHLRSENSLRFSRFSHTHLTMLDGEKGIVCEHDFLHT